MKNNLMGRDPRTVAREISGVFESIFPYLIPGVVANINKLSQPCPGALQISSTALAGCSIQKAMLFQIATSIVELKLSGTAQPDWNESLEHAANKQRFYYDAKIPKTISDAEKNIATSVSRNLTHMLGTIAENKGRTLEDIAVSPKIPGYSWISSGAGDFALGNILIEVKCSGKNFSAADYRQVLMYWLMSYLNAIESGEGEWKTCILINPRLNKFIEVEFNSLIRITSPGGSKIELLELFRAAIDFNQNTN